VGECPPQKHNFYPEINYAEQNVYLKILIGCVWGNGGRGRGVPISNRMSSFPSFYDISFDTKCPGLKKKDALCQHSFLLTQRDCAAYDTIATVFQWLRNYPLVLECLGLGYFATTISFFIHINQIGFL
jgi:hypothetical protein